MRKKNEWRYLVVLLILLALAMLGSRTQAESLAAQREQDALARGLQLKTTVSLDWDGAPFADEETGGMLRDVLENSWFVLLHETPEDGGSLYSFDWQLQGASVLDWTGMRQNGGLLEQSNLWGGRTVRSAAKTIDFAAVWNAWREDALTSTVTPLADMTAQITVLTQPEAVSLLDALCAAVDGADWLWQPSLPQTDGADEAAAQLHTLRDTLRALPNARRAGRCERRARFLRGQGCGGKRRLPSDGCDACRRNVPRGMDARGGRAADRRDGRGRNRGRSPYD